jgi:hypothetical protein
VPVQAPSATQKAAAAQADHNAPYGYRRALGQPKKATSA